MKKAALFQLSLVGLSISLPSFAHAQSDDAVATMPSVLDPDSPLADLPDIGVAWPTLDTGTAIAISQEAARPKDLNALGRYSVRIESQGDPLPPELVSRFGNISVLKASEKKPANTAQIDRRSREDGTNLRELLHAAGYYDAKIVTRVERSEAGNSVVVILGVTPGPMYRFADVKVTGLETANPEAIRMGAAFAIKPHDPVDADLVIKAETDLVTNLLRGGFPFAEVTPSEVTLDHETRTANLKLAINAGPLQNFGQILVRGEKAPFGAGHVARLARIVPGSRYDLAKVNDLQRTILATGLVSSVKLVPQTSATNPDAVDLVATLEPAPLRTIAAEFGVGTGEGVQAEVSWTHRNLIKPEGAVTVRAIAGTSEQLFGSQLRMNNFRKRDQVLNARIVATNINRSAFDARSLELGVGLERQTTLIWQKRWTWSVGAEMVLSDERDITAAGINRQTFVIGAFPLALAYDGSNDLLDPTRGFRISARLTPEVSFQSGSFGYVRSLVDVSGYQPLSDRLVLAGRFRVGSLLGSNGITVAPSRRLYSGGGSSVRGYGYQRVGPLDALNEPMGGSSLAEFGLETRYRLGSFSVVTFLDGGNVFDSVVPSFNDFRFGAGIGLRYHSSFGPIRIDLGTPINPQPGDSRLGFYVSLGQAF